MFNLMSQNTLVMFPSHLTHTVFYTNIKGRYLNIHLVIMG